MDLLDVGKEDEITRELTRSALGPLVGESSSDDLDDVTPSRSSGVVEDRVDEEDDLDDEITAVFNENDQDDCMSKSWQGSRSSSQRSLAFFVDLSSSGPAPGINRSTSYSQDQRRVASARSRTRAGSCSTSFFVDMSEDKKMNRVRSISRLENSDQLNDLSNDISNKSKQLLAKNVEESQKFFTKLKAFIDFLNKPNYSKEEVRHKKVLADKITRVMFEEEQRLRRGMDLSEIKNLESILSVDKIRPNSAYAAMQNPKNQSKALKDTPTTTSTPSKKSQSSETPEMKPVLRREKTFDMEQGSIFSKELKLLKKKNRNSMPVTLDIPIIDDETEKKSILKETVVKNGWMIDEGSEKDNCETWYEECKY